MSGRFDRPPAGPPAVVRFPEIQRSQLDNGLLIWVIPYGALPVATMSLVIGRGTAHDPVDRHGLASLTGDMLDEGAGPLDAIALTDAFARVGTQLTVDVGPDTMTLSLAGLSSSFEQALALVGDVVRRPRLAESDFDRVRDLRVNRLRQLSRSAGTVADRTYVTAVFGDHVYGHGALGTTSALAGMTIDDARTFWTNHIGPSAATLIVVGDIASDDVVRAAARVFGTWDQQPVDVPDPPEVSAADPKILLVDRPGAAQSELRLGHVGPRRNTPLFHPLVVGNAVLGGQFTSRINRRLREEKGVTYGAHTSFDFRRLAGSFSCVTSVQTDATTESVADVLDELDEIRLTLVDESELAAARASLTRGYVRNFETGGQILRAAVQLVTYDLPDDTFDRFVEAVEAVEADDVLVAAEEVIRPAEATIVVVGDADATQPMLEQLGRPVVRTAPEF
jgi:zinc protease